MLNPFQSGQAPLSACFQFSVNREWPIIMIRSTPNATSKPRGSDFEPASAGHRIYRALLLIGLIVGTTLQSTASHATNANQLKFKRIPTQFIAALGKPGASSGSNAQSWGLWRLDPGPHDTRR